jgi:hypothetical protein
MKHLLVNLKCEVKKGNSNDNHSYGAMNVGKYTDCTSVLCNSYDEVFISTKRYVNIHINKVYLVSYIKNDKIGKAYSSMYKTAGLMIFFVVIFIKCMTYYLKNMLIF